MTNRRTLTLVLALVLAGALALPSAASPLFAGPTDQLGNDVELAPSSDYAYLADDELVVDISPANPALEGDGVNADARTTIREVFRIRYTGPQYAHVWLTHGSDAVTFAVDGQPIQSEANNVTLAPNESVAVSLTVDTTGDTADGLVDDITIHSRVAEAGTLEAEAATEEPLDGFAKQSRAPDDETRRFTVLSSTPGESIGFDADRLALDRVGNQTLTFDGLTVTSPDRTVSVTAESTGVDEAESAVVAAGAEPLGAVRLTETTGRVSRATVRFSGSESYFETLEVDPDHLTLYRYDDGSLSELGVTMTGERDGRVTFEAETPGFSTFVVAVRQPRLELRDVGIDAATVAPGETVTVSASVSNTGTLAGERAVTVAVDGEVAAERTLTVAPGETETVSVPVVRNESGEYAVTVNGDEAGAFTVAEQSTATPSTGDDADGTAATEEPVAEPGGFGLQSLLGLLGLLTILAATLVLVRRAPRP